MPVAILIVGVAPAARLRRPASAAAVPVRGGGNPEYEAKLGLSPDRDRDRHGESDGTGAGRGRVRLRRLRGRAAARDPGRYELTSWTPLGRASTPSGFTGKLVQGEQRGRAALPDRPRLEPVPARRVAGRTGWRRETRSTSWRSSTISAPRRSRRARPISISRYFKTGYNPIQVRVLGRESVTAVRRPHGAACFILEVTTRAAPRCGVPADRRCRGGSRSSWRLPLPFGTRDALELAQRAVSTSQVRSRSPTGSPAGCTAAPRSAWPPGSARSGARPAPPSPRRPSRTLQRLVQVARQLVDPVLPPLAVAHREDVPVDRLAGLAASARRRRARPRAAPRAPGTDCRTGRACGARSGCPSPRRSGMRTSGRAVAHRPGDVDRRLVARHQPLVAVDQRVGDRAEAARVPQQALDVVQRHLGELVLGLRDRRTRSPCPRNSDWWVCMPLPLMP